MDGAVAVHELGVGLHLLAAHAVLGLVVLFIDVAVLLAALPELLRGRLMMLVGGANVMEDALVQAEDLDRFLEALEALVDVRLRRHVVLRGRLIDLHAVLVRAGVEEDIKALERLIAGDDVGAHELKRVTHVQVGVHVRQCGGEIEGLFHRPPYFIWVSGY